MEADVKNLRDNPQTTLLEGLHSVAYTGGLGRPLIVPEGLLGGLNAGEICVRNVPVRARVWQLCCQPEGVVQTEVQ